jgi:hypothetical protein
VDDYTRNHKKEHLAVGLSVVPVDKEIHRHKKTAREYDVADADQIGNSVDQMAVTLTARKSRWMPVLDLVLCT